MASYCVRVTCNYDILFLFFYSKDYDDKIIFSLESTKTRKAMIP